MAIDCRDLSSLLDSYTEHKENVGSGPAASPAARSSTCRSTICRRARGPICAAPQPLVDVQINCDPLLGMQQLDDGDPPAAREGRRRARARSSSAASSRPSATRPCAPRQRENARKGWDDRPIRPGRMVSELWNAVKDKNWLLAMRN